MAACWHPGSLACTGVYQLELQPFSAGDPPAVGPLATFSEGELDAERGLTGHSAALAGQAQPCVCLNAIWDMLSAGLPACEGRHCLAAAQQALMRAYFLCSRPACLQSLAQAIKGPLL